jgi:hypothetical protein
MHTSHVPARLARQIAAAADTDPRTVRRVVLGLPTWPSTRERIMRAIAAHADSVDCVPSQPGTESTL